MYVGSIVESVQDADDDDDNDDDGEALTRANHFPKLFSSFWCLATALR